MTSSAPAGLVGRARELAGLEDLLARVAAGRGGVAWIAGEPGIGKTSLVTALTDAARQRGCLVRRAAGDELTGDFPLRLMADCLQISPYSTNSSIVEIARLLRGHHEAPAAGDPVMAAAERMMDLVDRLCASTPLVLVMEDLHWSDQPSLALWSRLVRAVSQIPLLLIGTARPVPHRPALDRLSSAMINQGGTLLELEPLNPDETIEVARRILKAEPGPRLMAELARTGGNPLYTRELVEALRLVGSLESLGEKVELVDDAGLVPESLAATISRQLSFLSEPTRDALRVAALLGPEFGAAEWALVLGQSSVQMLDSVQEAISGGVICAGQHSLRFRHELVRQVMLEQTPTTLRTEISRDIARALAEGGYGPDSVARQLLTTPALDDWALNWLANTPERALHSAPAGYEPLLRRAFATLGKDDLRWEALAVQLAQVQYWLGRDDEAVTSAMAVLRSTTDLELAGRMGVQAVRAAGRRKKPDTAVALADEALAKPGMLPHWRARLRSWKALGRLATGRSHQEGYSRAL